MTSRKLGMGSEGAVDKPKAPPAKAPTPASTETAAPQFGSTVISESRMASRASRSARGGQSEVVRKAFRRMALVPINHDNPQGRDVANTQQAGRELGTASRVGLLDRLGLLHVGEESQGTPNEYLKHEQKIIKVYEAQCEKLRNGIESAISDPKGALRGPSGKTWVEGLRELGVHFPTTAAYKAAALELLTENAAVISRNTPTQEVLAEFYAKQFGAIRVKPETDREGAPVSCARLLHGFIATNPQGGKEVVGIDHRGRPAVVTGGIIDRTAGEGAGSPAEEVAMPVAKQPIQDWLLARGVDAALLQTEFQGQGHEAIVSQGLLDRLADQGIQPLYGRVHQEDLLPEGFNGTTRAFGSDLALSAVARCRDDINAFMEVQDAEMRVWLSSLEAAIRTPERWEAVKASPAIGGDEKRANALVQAMYAPGGGFSQQWANERGVPLGRYLLAVADYQGKYGQVKASLKESPFMGSVLPGLDVALEGYLGAETRDRLLSQRLPGVNGRGQARPAKNTIGVEVDSLFVKADASYKDREVPQHLVRQVGAGRIGEIDGIRAHIASGALAMADARERLREAYAHMLGNLAPADRDSKVAAFDEKVLNSVLGDAAQGVAAAALARQVVSLDRANSEMVHAAKNLEVVALTQVILSDPGAFGVDATQQALLAERVGVVIGAWPENHQNLAGDANLKAFHDKVAALLERDARGEFKNDLLRIALDPHQDPRAIAEARLGAKPQAKSAMVNALSRAREYMRMLGEVDLAMATFHRDFGSLSRHLRWTGKLVRDHAFAKGRGQWPITVNYPEPNERTGRKAYSVAVPLEGRQGGETWAYVGFAKTMDGVLRPDGVKLLSRRELIRQGIEDNEADVRMDIGQRAVDRDRVVDGFMAASNAMKLRPNEYLLSLRVASSGEMLSRLGISIAGTFKVQDRTYDFGKASGRKSPFATMDLQNHPLPGPHFTVTDLGRGRDLGGVLFFKADRDGVAAFGEMLDTRAASLGLRTKAEQDLFTRTKVRMMELAEANIEALRKAETELRQIQTVVLMPAGGAGGASAEPSIFDMAVVDREDGLGVLGGVNELVAFRASLGAHCEPVVVRTENLVVE